MEHQQRYQSEAWTVFHKGMRENQQHLGQEKNKSNPSYGYGLKHISHPQQKIYIIKHRSWICFEPPSMEMQLESNLNDFNFSKCLHPPSLPFSQILHCSESQDFLKISPCTWLIAQVASIPRSCPVLQQQGRNSGTFVCCEVLPEHMDVSPGICSPGLVPFMGAPAGQCNEHQRRVC